MLRRALMDLGLAGLLGLASCREPTVPERSAVPEPAPEPWLVIVESEPSRPEPPPLEARGLDAFIGAPLTTTTELGAVW